MSYTAERSGRSAVRGIRAAGAIFLRTMFLADYFVNGAFRREDQRGTFGGARAGDQLLVEAAIAHEVHLKPERFLDSLVNVLN